MQSKRKAALWRRAKREKDRAAILEILGARCKECGFDDPRALHIDHKNGNGHAERKKFGGAYYANILARIRGGADCYQVLCANHNLIKKYTNQEHTPRKYDGVYVREPLRPCGTHAAYHRGCRCDKCKIAHCAYVRAAQQKAKKRIIAGLRSGPSVGSYPTHAGSNPAPATATTRSGTGPS